MSDFRWYKPNGDGTADVFEDSPEIRARVDAEPGWYGSPEGAVLNGGVRATAFTVKTAATYEADAWFRTGELRPAGALRTVTITAPAGDADQTSESMIDWYERRHELEPEQIFRMHDGSIVKLDRQVPGDGSAWIIAEWSHGSWAYYESRIEPGDLAERLPEVPDDAEERAEESFEP